MGFSDRIGAVANKLIAFYRTSRRAMQWKKTVAKRIGHKSILTVQQKKEVRAFYQKYLKTDLRFHEFYTQKTGVFCENYLPDDVYYCKIDPFFNNWQAARQLDNKCYYDRWYFPNVNVPENIIKRINGLWTVVRNEEIQFVSVNEAYNIISQHTCFAKKAMNSVGGKGVQKIGKGTSVDEIEKIVGSLQGDIVVQKAIEQSSEMCKLSLNSVNTIRVLSFLDTSGIAKVYSTIVRMSVNNAFVDNASSGGITCGVESDGRLKAVAYSASGVCYDRHPGTGIEFNSVVIPNYGKIVALAQKLHKDFPHFRLLSWDFAVDKNDEPVLIEVNLCYGELDFHQLNNGPLFGEDTKKILDEVFGK